MGDDSFRPNPTSSPSKSIFILLGYAYIIKKICVESRFGVLLQECRVFFMSIVEMSNILVLLK